MAGCAIIAGGRGQDDGRACVHAADGPWQSVINQLLPLFFHRLTATCQVELQKIK
jgi:hypothetical protein